MAKRGGGFGGGMGGGGMNMQNMMAQAQKMQQNIEKVQAEVEAREVEATAGGGAVKVVVSGKREMKSIEIAPEVVDPDDIEMLQDIIIAAVNEAMTTAETMMNEEMSKVTGGMNMGGLF